MFAPSGAFSAILSAAAKAAHHCGSPSPFRVLRQQSVERLDLDGRRVAKDLSGQRDTLLLCHERHLLIVDQNGDDHTLEEHGGTADEIDVAERERVERAGHDGQPAMRFAHRHHEANASS